MPLDVAAIQRFIETSTIHYIDLNPILICPICYEGLRDPVCCTTGDHVFCRKCSNQWIRDSHYQPTCPMDRRPMPQPRNCPKLVHDLIRDSCVLCSLGCGWVGKRSEWDSHLLTDCLQTRGNAPVPNTDIAMASNSNMQVCPDVEPQQTTLSDRELEEAREQLQAATVEPEAEDHTGQICDICDLNINGPRYKCKFGLSRLTPNHPHIDIAGLICNDFDICSMCWPGHSHDARHSFVLIRSSADYFEGTDAAHVPYTSPHTGITCDGCSARNFLSTRFKCTV